MVPADRKFRQDSKEKILLKSDLIPVLTQKQKTPFLALWSLFLLWWIPDCNEKHKLSRGPFNKHSHQAWFQLVQWFQRRRLKCKRLQTTKQMTVIGAGELKRSLYNKTDSSLNPSSQAS